MKTFTEYLDLIEESIRSDHLDKAWRLANEGAVSLSDKFERDMMYYQMSLIRRKEKHYSSSLTLMGIVVGLYNSGEIRADMSRSHEKHIRFLLGKIEKEDKFNEYISLCKGGHKEIIRRIENWVKDKWGITP